MGWARTICRLAGWLARRPAGRAAEVGEYSKVGSKLSASDRVPQDQVRRGHPAQALLISGKQEYWPIHSW